MVVNELRGEKIDIVPFSDDAADFVMKALSPARVKEVRIHEDTGTAEVIVPDYQLSLAIGKEGQNARLAARLTGWRVDIKSETQLAEEAAYQTDDWAQGEWIVHPETGEQMWQPADGTPAMTAEEWSQLGAEQAEAEDAEAGSDGEAPAADAATAEAPAEAVDEPADAAATSAEEPAEAADEADEAVHADEPAKEALDEDATDVEDAPATEATEPAEETGTEDAPVEGTVAAADEATS
jgi:N utilization substance protein A